MSVRRGSIAEAGPGNLAGEFAGWPCPGCKVVLRPSPDVGLGRARNRLVFSVFGMPREIIFTRQVQMEISTNPLDHAPRKMPCEGLAPSHGVPGRWVQIARDLLRERHKKNRIHGVHRLWEGDVLWAKEQEGGYLTVSEEGGREG